MEIGGAVETVEPVETKWMEGEGELGGQTAPPEGIEGLFVRVRPAMGEAQKCPVEAQGAA